MLHNRFQSSLCDRASLFPKERFHIKIEVVSKQIGILRELRSVLVKRRLSIFDFFFRIVDPVVCKVHFGIEIPVAFLVRHSCELKIRKVV